MIWGHSGFSFCDWIFDFSVGWHLMFSSLFFLCLRIDTSRLVPPSVSDLRPNVWTPSLTFCPFFPLLLQESLSPAPTLCGKFIHRLQHKTGTPRLVTQLPQGQGYSLLSGHSTALSVSASGEAWRAGLGEAVPGQDLNKRHLGAPTLQTRTQLFSISLPARGRLRAAASELSKPVWAPSLPGSSGSGELFLQLSVPGEAPSAAALFPASPPEDSAATLAFPLKENQKERNPKITPYFLGITSGIQQLFFSTPNRRETLPKPFT